MEFLVPSEWRSMRWIGEVILGQRELALKFNVETEPKFQVDRAFLILPAIRVRTNIQLEGVWIEQIRFVGNDKCVN